MLLLLTIGIFLGFFVQTISGFAGALVALPFLLLVMVSVANSNRLFVFLGASETTLLGEKLTKYLANAGFVFLRVAGSNSRFNQLLSG